MQPTEVKRYQAALQGRRPQVQDETGRFAILALLCSYEGEDALLFELRADSLRGQPGETCLPGGRIEEGESPRAAALRECLEEIGVGAEDITIIAPLDLIVDISNRVIYPFLGALHAEGLAKLAPNPTEVKELFFIPLRHLQTQAPYVYPATVKVEIGPDFPYEKIGMPASYRWRGGLIDVPIYEYRGKTVWGLTARCVRALLHILEEVNLR